MTAPHVRAAFGDALRSSVRAMREDQARMTFSYSPLYAAMLPEADRAAYRDRCEANLAYALDEIRLDYEVGPRFGPGRREWYEVTRGRRAVEAVSGRPGPLAWRRRR